MHVSKMWESIETQIQASLKTAQDLSVDLNDCVNDVQVNSLQYCSDQDEIHATVSKSFIRVDIPLVRSSCNSVDARTCTGSGDPPSAIPFCYTGSKLGERVNLKVNSFDSEADSFDLTGSGLEDIQVGNACWKLFCLKHDIQPNSGTTRFQTVSQPLNLLGVHGEAWQGDVARCHRSRHGVMYSDGGEERRRSLRGEVCACTLISTPPD